MVNRCKRAIYLNQIAFESYHDDVDFAKAPLVLQSVIPL